MVEAGFCERCLSLDNKTGVRLNSDKGTAGELLFCYEAFNRGLSPCVPWGSPACFDTVVINKKTGVPLVVQVRTATMKNTNKGGSGLRWQVKATCNNDTLHIRETNVKVLVVYCAAPKAWYCIPVKNISAKTVNLYPHNKISTGSYEKFKDNWGCFGFSWDDQVLLS